MGCVVELAFKVASGELKVELSSFNSRFVKWTTAHNPNHCTITSVSEGVYDCAFLTFI